jgi:Sulfotransferase family
MTLPSFVVIGAGKSGTTALYHYLAQHPGIFMGGREARFFAFEGTQPGFRGPGDDNLNSHIVTTIERYEALFEGATSEQVVGEVSPLYLYCEGTAERMHRHVPNMRVIAVLRHPAERAFSQYLMMVRLGLETLSFEDGLEAEDDRLGRGWAPVWAYRGRGFYASQLQRYFDTFAPEQISIYLYTDFVERPLALLSDVFAFVGVDEEFAPDVSERHNVSRIPRSRRLQNLLARADGLAARAGLPWRATRSLRRLTTVRPTLRQATRDRLVDVYREDILQLEKLLGRDLSSWLTSATTR